MAPIDKVAHDIVYIEYDMKAKKIKHASHIIYLYNRADVTGIRNNIFQFKEPYLSEDHSHMWVKFKTGFLEIVERFIPKK